ncbi:MAG: hypothetical protein JSU66_07105 [Deltaproteobacteria bacterium]|nr:MAG: hypothetical protein JSU66_07105 [Deltaproteobacteria bacterium]
MRHTGRALRITRRALACGVLFAATAGVADPVSWRRSLRLAADTAPSALAFDPERQRLAVGDAAGVYLGEPGLPLRRVARRAAVRDLAFLESGALLVATENGLFRLGPDGRLEDRSPGPADTSRSIHRIARSGELLAVATDGGAYLSRDARTWQRVRGALPSGSVEAVALRRGAGEVELWLVVQGAVWRAALPIGLAAEPGVAPRALSAAPRPAGFEGSGREAVDVVPDLPGVGLAVVLRDGIAVRDAPERAFRRLHPTLPPGAAIARLAFAAGRFWLATDAGLLEAAQLEGPWRRAEPPAGRARSASILSAGSVLYAATSSGLLEGRIRAARDRAAPAFGAPEPPRPEAPAIERVHRVALDYLDLGPERMRRLRSGVDRRGLLPVATLRFARDSHHGSRREGDESFVSGETRHLFDWEQDRDRDYEVSLALTWDLGDALYHPEAIDVSREAREVLELRDDVLDEINQLYFERRRVIEELASLDPGRARDAFELRRRADELAAGLDAWTGGWFGRQAPPLLPASGPAAAHPGD